MTALAIRPWLAIQGIARAVVQIPSASRSGQSGWIQCKRTATEAVVRLETDGSKGTQASSDFPVDVVANTLSERQSIRAETVVSIAARDRQRHGRIEYAAKILEQWIAMVEAQWIAIVEIQVEGLQLSHT